jgi:hypothetical protein
MPAICQNDVKTKKHHKADSQQKNIALFDSDKLLEVTLDLDLKAYLKKNLKIPIDAVLTFHMSNTDSLVRNITVNSRGNFRSSNCNLPPMQIRFKEKVYAYSDTDRIRKVKLITRCQLTSIYDEYVLREYLVYKLFNVLTDTSFRVRLLKLSIVDTQKEKKPLVQYGFFIEPKEIIARRTNSILIKTAALTQKDIIPSVMDRLAIFNYMVSNYDWSLQGEHNVAVIKPTVPILNTLGIAIPYDFDLTGIVNAEYAVPSEETGLNTIRDRKFMGICRSKEVYEADLRKFLNKKEEFYNVINEFPYLNQRAKKDITNFLDKFFNPL